MVNQEFEIVLAFTALLMGIGMFWLTRSQPD